MGRPTKLTDQAREEICAALEIGASYTLAAEYAGVVYATFNNWMIRGEAAAAARERGEPIPAAERRFLQFFEAVRSSLANAGVSWLTVLNTAAKQEPQWAAWLLQRRFPDDYAQPRQPLEVSGPQGGPVQVHTIVVELPAGATDTADARDA